MVWLYGLLSASFSVPRCRSPMCGSALWMTSPSISSTKRSTPWAAGCWGPKLRVKLRISAIGLRILESRLVAVVLADHLGHQRAGFDRNRLVHDAALLWVIAHFDVADQREILAERMADEAVVGEDATQIGVTTKQYAVEVERFALEPVCRGPDRDHRIDHRLGVVGAEHAQAQPRVVCNRK